MKVLAVLALCVATAMAGVVDHERCGGVGTFRQLRISNCQGAICYMTPGTPYNAEGDFVPAAAAPILKLKVSVTYLGFPITIIDTDLPNSSIQPGVQYTVTFTITPNDQLSGNTVPVRMEVSDSGSGRLEACVTCRAHIN